MLWVTNLNVCWSENRNRKHMLCALPVLRHFTTVYDRYESLVASVGKPSNGLTILYVYDMQYVPKGNSTEFRYSLLSDSVYDIIDESYTLGVLSTLHASVGSL